MALGQFVDLRNLRRNINLRGIEDPAELAAELEKILMQSVTMQNSGSKLFQKGALKELSQIRNDLISGNLNAGKRTAQMVGTYSHVIDQIEGMLNDNKKTNSAFSSSADAIRNSIPSADTFIAALMTANPIMGYSVKVLRDLSRSRKAANSERKAEAAKRLEALRNEQQYITEQMRQVEEEKEVAEVQKDVAEKQKREYTRGGIYKPLLEEINNQIKILQEIWGYEGDKKDNLEELAEQQLEAIETASQDQIEAMRELEEENDRDEKLTRLRDGPADDGIPDIDTNTLGPNQQGSQGAGNLGFLGMLGAPGQALAGLIGGVVGGLTGVLSAFTLAPLKAVVRLITGVAGIGSRIIAPLAIIKGLYDFVDGFLNADRIVGTPDPQLGQRLAAGFSNLFGNVAKLADWILEVAGFDLFDSEGIEKTIYKGFEAISTGIVDAIFFVQDTVTEAIDKVKSTASGIYDSVTTAISDTINAIVSIYTSIVDAITQRVTSIKNSLSTIPVIGSVFDDDSSNDRVIGQEGLKDLGGSIQYGIGGVGAGYSAGNRASNAIRREEANVTNNNAVNSTVYAPVDASTQNNNTWEVNSATSSNQNNTFRMLQNANFGNR
jgi:hypothetical protein